MSNTIANIVYGIPYTPKIAAAILEHRDELSAELGYEVDPREIGHLGFQELYTANGFTPVGYCGKLLRRYTAGRDIPVDELPRPTDEQEAEAWAEIGKLPSVIRDVLPRFTVWIIWSDS